MAKKEREQGATTKANVNTRKKSGKHVGVRTDVQVLNVAIPETQKDLFRLVQDRVGPQRYRSLLRLLKALDAEENKTSSRHHEKVIDAGFSQKAPPTKVGPYSTAARKAKSASRRKMVPEWIEEHVKKFICCCFSESVSFSSAMEPKFKIGPFAKAILGRLLATDKKSTWLRYEIGIFGTHVEESKSYYPAKECEDDDMFSGETAIACKVLNRTHMTGIWFGYTQSTSRHNAKEYADIENERHMLHTCEDRLHDLNLEIDQNARALEKLTLIEQWLAEVAFYESPNSWRTIKFDDLAGSSQDRYYFSMLRTRAEALQSSLRGGDCKRVELWTQGTQKLSLSPDFFSPHDITAILRGIQNSKVQVPDECGWRTEEDEARAKREKEIIASGLCNNAAEVVPMYLKYIKERDKKVRTQRENEEHGWRETRRKYIPSTRNLQRTVYENKCFASYREESLLQEIPKIAALHKRDAVRLGEGEKKSDGFNCDDVASQKVIVNPCTIALQFETATLHGLAMQLLRTSRNATKKCSRRDIKGCVQRFKDVVTLLFKVHVQDDGGYSDVRPEANVGERTFYGNEKLYRIVRLYHMMLVRLFTARLCAEKEAAERRYRDNLNLVGKQRMSKLRHEKLYLRNPGRFGKPQVPQRGEQDSAPDTSKDMISTVTVLSSPNDANCRFNDFIDLLKRRLCKNVSITSYRENLNAILGLDAYPVTTLPRCIALLQEEIAVFFSEELDKVPLKAYKEDERRVRILPRNNVSIEPVSIGEEKHLKDVQSTPSEQKTASTDATRWLFQFTCRYSEEFVDKDDIQRRDFFNSCSGMAGDVCRVDIILLEHPGVDFKRFSADKEKKNMAQRSPTRATRKRKR